MEGALIVDFNECVGYEVGKGEMIYLPRSADFKIFAKESADLIILSYGIPVQLCDKLSLSQLGAFVTDFKYEFKSLDIRVPLDTFLKLLVKYLDSGMSCQHMHELKQKELFLILRAYYTKEEKVNFFYHSIAASLTFKDKVMGVYLEARTVQELADKCGYGLKTFQRLFYSCFSEVPSKWLMKQKAQHVKARLLDRDIPIKVILDEFGFSTYANFCNYCKRYVGDTPRNIRESVTLGFRK